jgi:ketosteroid isomerase-like protein
MNTEQLISLVGGIYSAFGKGDIPAILEHVQEDTVWEYGHTGHGVPWLLPRKGKAGAGEFFASIPQYLDIQKFAVNALLGGAATDGHPLVAACVDIEAVVKPTGKRFIENDEVHLWHFDTRGRLTKFRHVVDSHQHVTAFAR